MSLPLTPPECFAVVILVFAVVGLLRGARRELISLAFILAGVLFLVVFNGGPGLAHFIFVRAPVIFADLLGQSAPRPNNEPSTQIVAIVTLVAFFILLALGYLIGNRVMPRGTRPADRIWGIVPAVISGFAVVYFLNNFLAKNQSGNSLLTLAVQTPNPGQYIVVFFVIVVVVGVIGLLAWWWLG